LRDPRCGSRPYSARGNTDRVRPRPCHAPRGGGDRRRPRRPLGDDAGASRDAHRAGRFGRGGGEPADGPGRGLRGRVAVPRIGRVGGGALAAAAAIAALVGVSGCASPGAGIQSGEHVTVYVSMPLRGPGSRGGRDAADGARLALATAHRKVGELAVRARYLDDTAGGVRSARWSGAVAAAKPRPAAPAATATAT